MLLLSMFSHREIRKVYRRTGSNKKTIEILKVAKKIGISTNIALKIRKQSEDLNSMPKYSPNDLKRLLKP